MNRDITELWAEAEETGEPVDVGAVVVCDMCSVDYTERGDMGGFIFGSYAYCPLCAATHLPKIRGYGEEHFIRARCPAGTTFADFIRQHRQSTGSTYIQISRFGS